MARRKRPENETAEETLQRRLLERVADSATRGEKVAWDRKMDGMVSLLSQLTPIEDKITDAMAKKMPLMDKIAALRAEMVKDCVHSYTNLAIRPDGTVQCKFCMTNFQVLSNGNKKTTNSKT